MKLNLQKARELKENFEFKKKADIAHKTLHRKGLVHTRRHIVSRVESLKNINTKRLVTSWSAKFILILALGLFSFSRLNSAGRFKGFINGGNVIVGVRDDETKLNLNPLTISSPAESAIAKLIYSSPLKYDQKGKLQGDLAESYSIEDSGKKFKFKIWDSAKWHDGKDITADDVVFTINKLKDPAIGSSLSDSLAGVDVTAIDSKDVEIDSPKAVTGLGDLLTKIKIAPKHIFAGLDSDQIATANYNEVPVGSGPLQVAGDLEARDESTLGIGGGGEFQQLSLVPNNAYFGNAAQANVTFRIFKDKDDLSQAFSNGSIEIYLGSGEKVNADDDTGEIDLKLSSGVFSFFNTQSPTLKDTRLRQALAGYIDRKALNELSGGVKPLYSPVLETGDTEQPIMSADAAKKLISEAGWQFDTKRSVFVKDGQDLRLSLVTGDSDEYSEVADKLVKDWGQIGVEFDVVKAPNSELQSNYFVNKTYDVLLYGISLNQASDPYAYWSSSSATAKGLNFSEYKSPASDADLDIARTKLDPAERIARLDRFVTRWRQDAPAAALYIPSIKVVYRQSAVQPEPNQEASLSGYGDAFEFLTNIKATRKKLYTTES